MMESDLLNEQINTLTSEYADTFRNINASSLTSVDVSSLESEVEALKSELVNAEEDLKWATNLIENAQKDMEEKNMGAIPNDPFFENNLISLYLINSIISVSIIFLLFFLNTYFFI